MLVGVQASRLVHSQDRIEQPLRAFARNAPVGPPGGPIRGIYLN